MFPIHGPRLIHFACLLASLAILPLMADAKEQAPPQVSPEGLQLQKSKDARLVYLRPGATFDQYDRILLLDSYVEFAKNWQREQNASTMGLEGRVTSQDMDRMKAAVAAAFREQFAKELQKGGYQIVDAPAPDVLTLRPAILDLRVTAPDLQRTGLDTTIVRSAGQMTLYLELWDSSTSTILARIMDAQADKFGGVANRASNKAAMDDILRDWAAKLRKHLDAVHGVPTD